MSSNTEKGPGVLFMHEMGNWVNNWNDSEVMIELIKSGYICMPFFFRGHGNSESISDIGVLIEDWSLITNDLKAALAYITSNEKVQSDNIVLAGGSLGEIMAIAGNGFSEVTASVAMSAPDFGYNTIFPNITPKGVFYIAAENLNISTSAHNMFSFSAEPKKILIISNSAAHGTVLFKTEGVNEEIVSWIKEHS